MHQSAIEQLEKQRLALQACQCTLSDLEESLDRGHGYQSAHDKAKIVVGLAAAKCQLAALQQQHQTYLQSLRQSTPEAVDAWVKLHLAALELILHAPPPLDLGISDKVLPVRQDVAHKTVQEWQEVLTGMRDYVSVNGYFLADYEQQLQALMTTTVASTHAA